MKSNILKKSNNLNAYGLIGGLIMALVLLLFQINGQDHAPFLKLCRYLILALFIGTALYQLNNEIKGKIFFPSIKTGLHISLLSGIALGLINLILFASVPEWSFSKYTLEPGTLFEAFTISVILFFETFVFGGIITFIFSQMLKQSPREI